jgi:UDP-N-acetylglucosamine 2-epimerase (non-hydrolysing)
MASSPRILLVFGTRPEAIKLAPVIMALKRHRDLETVVAVTAQHREMLDQVLDTFSISPDHDLDIMSPNQDLFDVTGKALGGVKGILEQVSPDLVLVQGDTTTTFVASLAAYYKKVPVGHVEAGLRTGDPYSPFPEEVNRKLTGVIAALHFAPTSRARENLLREGIPRERIHVTGNTAIDALLWTIEHTEPQSRIEWRGCVLGCSSDRFLVVTTHRRESFGAPMASIMEALATLASRFPSIPIVFPVHFNPNVRKQAEVRLRSVENILLIEPLDYREFAHLLARAHLILTDSGGIQEEAPALGRPVLVLRDTTERPEGIEAGTARLVGTDGDAIVAEATRLLTDDAHYRSMALAANPYGDGTASEKIVSHIRRYFSLDGPGI